jgi:hypothetical protein
MIKNQPYFIIIIIIIIIYNNCWKIFTDKNKLEQIGKNGENLLISLKEQSQSVVYGDCYKQVINLLEKNCKNIEQNDKLKIAVQLTNCHLKKSGFREFTCNSEMDIK